MYKRLAYNCYNNLLLSAVRPVVYVQVPLVFTPLPTTFTAFTVIKYTVWFDPFKGTHIVVEP